MSNKRKNVIPKRIDEVKRRKLCWNMMDDVKELDGISDTNDNDESHYYNTFKEAKLILDDKKQYKTILKKFDPKNETNLPIIIYKFKSDKINESEWSFLFGEFRVLALDSNINVKDLENFYEKLSEGFFEFDSQNFESTLNISVDSNINVSIPIAFDDTEIIIALKSKKFKATFVLYEGHGYFLFKLYLIKNALVNLDFPSQRRRFIYFTENMENLVNRFFGIVSEENDTCIKKQRIEKLNMNLKDVYNLIERPKSQLSLLNTDIVKCNHADLKVTLRPYQILAVTWMLEKEKSYTNTSDHILYTKIISKCGKTLYYHKYNHFFVENKPTIVTIPGGILAEEMGLGKTIEVLACVLSNPRGLKNEIEPLPIKKINLSDVNESSRNISKESAFYSNGEPKGNKSGLMKLDCVCGIDYIYAHDRNKIRCSMCKILQHIDCLNYDLEDPLRGIYKCPHCHVASPVIKSNATLIVTPKSISMQWVDEIKRHIGSETFTYFVYEGVSNGYIQPNLLASCDVVLTTYDVFKKETNNLDLPHAQDTTRRMRNSKRYMALPSPLVSIEWWRICLDEAQMVEGGLIKLTKIAQMALSLKSINRWCVTGTPIQRGIEDLYGLLLFLEIDPVNIKEWWKRVLLNPMFAGKIEPMKKLLNSIMWRNLKTYVYDQIDIPEQKETTQFLTFTPVEEYFYRTNRDMCINLVANNNKLSPLTPISKLDKADLNRVLNPLLRLRQACCHPKIVRGQMLWLNKLKVCTMETLLKNLIDLTFRTCEEHLRVSIASMNGLAAILLIENNIPEAVDMYRDVLSLINKYSNDIRADTTQKLHTLFNLNDVLKNNSDRNDIGRTLSDDNMENEIENLRTKHVNQSNINVTASIDAWTKVRNSVNEVITNDNKNWWIFFMEKCQSISDLSDMLLDKVKSDVIASSDNSSISTIRNIHGLKYIINRMSVEFFDGRKKLIENLNSLNVTPTEVFIAQVINCCSNNGLPKKTCALCKVHRLFEKYESKLFSIKETTMNMMQHQSDTEMDNSDQENTVKRSGNWADSEFEIIMKSILNFAKQSMNELIITKNVCNRITDYEECIENGVNYLKAFDKLKKEFRCMRSVWMTLRERIIAMDEINMATIRFRLRGENEPMPDPSLTYILEKHQVVEQRFTLTSDLNDAMESLKLKMGHLKYLKNLEASQKETINVDPCPVCSRKLKVKWSVLMCGHCICLRCIEVLSIREINIGCKIKKIKCPVCRLVVKTSEISFACKEVSNNDKILSDSVDNYQTLKGKHSTKIEAIVKYLIKIKKEDPTAKSLVFSTWKELLYVALESLRINNLKAVILENPKYNENLHKFKTCEDINILLLPINAGAKGLNLIEATHVLFMEPLINCAEKLQAVGRVHRIGQTKETFVHNFVIRQTVEEKIHLMFNNSEEMMEKFTIGDVSSLVKSDFTDFINVEQQDDDDDYSSVFDYNEYDNYSNDSEVENDEDNINSNIEENH